MSFGTGIRLQPRLRPVTSVVNGPNGQGIGLAFGMGTGAVRLAGFKWSAYDASDQYVMEGQAWRLRIVAINGPYPFSANAFTPDTDLTQYDVLADEIVEGQQEGHRNYSYGILVTDDGVALTVMASSFLWLPNPPAGLTPVVTIETLGDYNFNYRTGQPDRQGKDDDA